MESIFFIKRVGDMQNITNQKGEQIAKLSIILSTKEVRSGENGVFSIDQDIRLNRYVKL